MEEAKWYVVHTYSGYENKVKEDIDKTVANRELEDLIPEVRVPMEEVREIRNGVAKTVQHKLFPGYVLVNMVMTEETWYVVRNTRGVTGFVGPGSKPVPLTPEEMWPLGIGEGAKAPVSAKPKIVVDFAKDDMVVVIAGAWEGHEGVIQAVNPQKQTVTIMLEVFGRETPVEISFAEVKKK